MDFKGFILKLKTNKQLQKRTMLVVTAVILFVILLLLLIFVCKQQELPVTTDPTTEPPVSSTAPTTIPNPTTIPDPTTEPTVPPETKPTMLPHMEALYNQNSEIAGWLTIDNTVVDYPVMFTPDDPEKYIYKNFNGKYDAKGSLFIDGHCSIDPESDNIIIYGHNMLSGTMFRPVFLYQKGPIGRNIRSLNTQRSTRKERMR